MKNEILDIKLGKLYPASEIFEKMQGNSKVDVEFGHIVVNHHKTEKKHEYFTDKVIDKEYIKNLGNTPIQIYTVIPTAICKNFACTLLKNKEVRDILKEVEKDHTQICMLDKTDLSKANYKGSIRKAVMLINKMLKSNNMNFKASSHESGIKVVYKKIKEKECN